VENMEGHSIYYLKRIGELKTEEKFPQFQSQALEIVHDVIPTSMITSFNEFLKSINNRIPMEEELKEWHLVQILKETI
jgi:hypothetical protein